MEEQGLTLGSEGSYGTSSTASPEPTSGFAEPRPWDQTVSSVLVKGIRTCHPTFFFIVSDKKQLKELIKKEQVLAQLTEKSSGRCGKRSSGSPGSRGSQGVTRNLSLLSTSELLYL